MTTTAQKSKAVPRKEKWEQGEGVWRSQSDNGGTEKHSSAAENREEGLGGGG